MTTNPPGDDTGSYDDVDFSNYCDALEVQYIEAKETGLFDALNIFVLDKKNSDQNLVQALEYFKTNKGAVGPNAPMSFLNEREIKNVGRKNAFRPNLYCMLLSQKFSMGLGNKTLFIDHSYRYAFDSKHVD